MKEEEHMKKLARALDLQEAEFREEKEFKIYKERREALDKLNQFLDSKTYADLLDKIQEPLRKASSLLDYLLNNEGKNKKDYENYIKQAYNKDYTNTEEEK